MLDNEFKDGNTIVKMPFVKRPSDASIVNQETIIVTASDQKYFSFLQSAVLSIREKTQGQSIAIGFFDLGCTSQQIDWLRAHDIRICIPKWEYDFPLRDSKPDYLRGLLARPRLRSYFPNFEIYLWLDADAWVQSWTAIELLQRGARLRKGLAIVPEIDRCSVRQYGGLPAYWAQAFDWYKNAFDEPTAHRLCNFPMLNAGVYALHAEAPHWAIWDETLAQVLGKVCTVMTDQLALNHTVYCTSCMRSTEMLPACCNWVCHNGFPRWSIQEKAFVETYLPHSEIGILHLTTRDKSVIRRIHTIGEQTLELQMTYPPQVLTQSPSPA